MNPQTPSADLNELHFLLDDDGALVVFQENGAAWAGVLAFSNEERAREFWHISRLQAREIASIDTADRASVAALIASAKRRAIRYLLLDLDYRTGRCLQVEFEGDTLGTIRERQLGPRDRGH